MASSVIERLQVDIQSNAAQLQAEMAKGETAVRRLSRATAESATLAQANGQRYAQAGVQIASAFENMARAGKVGGDALKQVIVQGSNMAFLFGPQGAIVGAIGIGLVAVTEFFRRTRDETQSLAADTKRTLDDLQNRGDFTGLTDRAKTLFQGTPAAGFADGIRALRVELAGAERELEALRAKGAEAQSALRGQVGASQFAAAKIGSVPVSPLADLFEKVKADRTRIVAQLRQAEAEFNDIRRRLLAPGGDASGVRSPITTTASRGGASTQDPRATAQIVRDLTQGFDDLFARAAQGNVALVDFDRAVRELGDSFRDKLKKPTAEQTAVFTKFAEQALAVRTVLQNTAATKAAEEFETLRASLTPTVIDDFRVKLAKLRKELSEKFAPDQVEDLLGFEEALAKVAIGLETIEGRIAQVKSTAISSLDAQLGLMGLLQEVEAQLSKLETVEALAGGSEQSAIVIAGLRAQIAKLQQEIAAAGGNGPSNDDLRNQDQAQVKAQRLGRSIEDISRLTLTAADAFGVLSDEAAKALAATIDVAAGLGRIIAGDAAGGAAQLASGAISLIAGAVGKDPATEQRQREHVENLEVLRNIAKNTGDLLGISASGKSIAGVRDAVGLLLANTGNAGGFRRFGDAGPLRDVNEASFLEFQTGLSFKEIEALAKSLGITLNGTKQSYVDFLNALKRLDLEAITKGFSGQLRRLEIEARLDPTAFEGIEGLIKRLRVLTDQTDGAPAIARAIGDLDSLRTSEGRAAAIARLTETLRNISSLDVSDLGGLSLDQFIEEILAAIERLREMDPAAKKAGERFNDAMEAWGVAVELGTMTAEQRLQKIKDFVRLNFSGLNDEAFAALDFSSLDAMDASIAKIIDAFAADGELSDAEKEQIAMLRAVREAYKSTIPEAQKFSDALGVLQDRFAIFGTSAIDQFTALADALGEQFPSIGELLQGLDLKTDPQALDTLKARAQAIFDALAEGGVTTEEQAIIDAIKQILEAAADAADEIARDAADRLAAESARRQAILDRAETRIRLNDVTDPAEQLRIRVAALSEAFPALAAILGDFDVSTQDGRDAMEAWIQAIAGSPETLESLAAAMGVSVDELLSALVGLEDGADAAATKVATLAEKLGAAFDAADFETELEGITDPLEKLRRSATKVSDVMPELAALFKQFDVSTAQGRAGAEAALIALGKSTTDADVQRAVLRLLAQIRSVPVVGPSALQGTGSGSSGAAAASSANIAAAASITEVTANRLVDLFGRNVVATEQIRDALAGNLARALSPVPTVRAPLLPSQVAEQWGGMRGAAGLSSPIVVNLTLAFNGSVTTASEDELARLVQQRIYDLFQGALATELQVAVRRAGLSRAN